MPLKWTRGAKTRDYSLGPPSDDTPSGNTAGATGKLPGKVLDAVWRPRRRAARPVHDGPDPGYRLRSGAQQHTI
jgi:hypothetical protein